MTWKQCLLPETGLLFSSRDGRGKAEVRDREGVDQRHRRVAELVALAREGRHEEAIARLRQGLAGAPNSSRLVSLLAWELATGPDDGLRDGAEARQLAERLHQAYPNQPSSDLLAAALAETGDFEEAVRVGLDSDMCMRL